ncbi:MAG: DUF72 domain-containing protein [Cellvibrio sp.]|uniref:DUF72 domain-containing protein n=1 Tax=Cellvibrio sp. TaxID=1965322 RepID=UPI0031A8FC1D
MTLDQSSIYIGTSGIVLLGNKTTFPEEFRSSTRLQYYSSIFNSLEINSSFYKLPQAKTFAKWSHEVTENFTFSVKLSQSITHADKLNFEVEDIEKFTSATKELEKHKGAVLIQFPANITVDYSEKVLNILHHLTSLHTCSSWKLAVEVRHKSWYTNDFYAALQRHHASLVFHDMPGSRTPMDQTATEFIYVRFHGSSGKYTGTYDVGIIEDYAQRIRQWKNEGKTVFVYFNNTIGDAYNNALTLQRMLNL